MGVGQGPGLSSIDLGEVGGQEAVSLTQSQMPAHGHLASVTQAGQGSTRPANQVPSAGGAYAGASDGSTLSPAFVQSTGQNAPVPTIPPFLGLNYIIALEGIFPSRN